MPTLNNTLWAVGLALQCLLLWVLIRRGLSRIAPLFTALIGFYVLRSMLLFGLFGRVGTGVYALLVTVFSTIDIVFQTLVAFELLRFVPKPRTKPWSGALRDIARFCLLAVVSAACAWGVAVVLTASPRGHVDRGVLFTSFLMLAVFVQAGPAFGHSWRDRILQGFAALGVLAVASQVGRTLAAYHRDAPAYNRWSYVGTVSYLAVLVFWRITLSRPSRTSA